jgi:hypothetical protein
MRVTLAGEDLGEFDDEGMMLSEAFALKAATGLSLKPFYQGLNEMDPLAAQAVVWFLRYKRGDQIPLPEIEFRMGDLQMVPVEDPDPTVPAEDETTSAGSETTPSDSSPTTAD